VREYESLDEEQMVLEKIMLALRTSEGVSESYLLDKCLASKVEDALACGNLVRTGHGSIRIPEEKFFVSDGTISSIL
jgi:coproporphyrinogen III oxidase-like Fe-S oxidoreductase